MYNIRNLQTTNYGAGSNPTGSPIGGGTGYTRIISPSQATYVVSTLTDLKSRLASATSGQIIYISDTASIDMTGQSNIVIPAGVILASGRGSGTSLGALLYVTSATYPIFYVGGANVRVTGLRLQGHQTTVGTAVTYSTAIHSDKTNFEIDNCELWGWTYASIRLTAGAINAYVHHNFIHQNQGMGLGYGVITGQSSTSTNPSNVIIEANNFQANRHSIASTGEIYSDWEARYNVVLLSDTDHSFDRHGDGTPANWAGGWTLMHHNTMMSTTQQGIDIRGVPYNGAIINNNWFYHTSQSTAIATVSSTNIQISTNWYGTTTPPTGCTTLTSCTATCPTSSIQQGSPIILPVSWSGGQSPFTIQVFKDNVLYGNAISTTSPASVTITTDTSWAMGNHNVYIQITDSCSTGTQSCNSNTCLVNITSPPCPGVSITLTAT